MNQSTPSSISAAEEINRIYLEDSRTVADIAQIIETHMQEPQPAGQSVEEVAKTICNRLPYSFTEEDFEIIGQEISSFATSQQQAREKLEAWKSEIQGAIQRSGMGIMRTSQGPVGTMIAYTEKNEKRHQDKMLELIHENIDLGQQVKMDTECIERIRAAAVRDKFRADKVEAAVKTLRGALEMIAKSPYAADKAFAEEALESTKEFA